MWFRQRNNQERENKKKRKGPLTGRRIKLDLANGDKKNRQIKCTILLAEVESVRKLPINYIYTQFYMIFSLFSN